MGDVLTIWPRRDPLFVVDGRRRRIPEVLDGERKRVVGVVVWSIYSYVLYEGHGRNPPAAQDGEKF